MRSIPWGFSTAQRNAGSPLSWLTCLDIHTHKHTNTHRWTYFTVQELPSYIWMRTDRRHPRIGHLWVGRYCIRNKHNKHTGEFDTNLREERVEAGRRGEWAERTEWEEGINKHRHGGVTVRKRDWVMRVWISDFYLHLTFVPGIGSRFGCESQREWVY